MTHFHREHLTTQRIALLPVRRLQSAVRWCAGLLGIGSLTVLAGWFFGLSVLHAPLPGAVSMMPNTAVAFLLGGIMLWSVGAPNQNWTRTTLLAVLITLIGLVTLTEYLTGWDPGLDLILFPGTVTGSPPGRMAPTTALGFVLLGTATIGARRNRFVLTDLAALLVGLISVLALIGYAYGVGMLYGLPSLTPMAVHTAALLLAFSVGLLLSHVEHGLFRPVIENGSGGTMARRVIPLAIGLPIVLGWIVVQGRRIGLYSESLGTAILVVSTVGVLGGFILQSAGVLSLLEAERRRTQSALERSRIRAQADRRFRELLESAPDAMVISDPEGRIVLVNEQTERLFGYSRADLIGQSIDLLIPERLRTGHESHRRRYLREPTVRAMGGGRELYARRRDGSEFPAEISLSPLEDEAGRLISSSIRDVTDSRRSRDALAATAAEKELLLQELHHRVKNNLQLITSLLNLERESVVDAEGRRGLEHTLGRVHSLALLHEMLYRSPQLAQVDLPAYLRRLVLTLGESSGHPSIRFQFSLEPLWVGIDQAVPCGLIVNELVTNSLKHAFRPGSLGAIRIGLARGPEFIRLVVADNGKGLSRDFDPQRDGALGLRLVGLLVEQLHGELIAGQSPFEPERTGTQFEIRFGAAGNRTAKPMGVS